jgi:hypothetical protein
MIVQVPAQRGRPVNILSWKLRRATFVELRQAAAKLL